jgi:4-hydroxy-4-methyl-2-oxoglutarate aldolase
LVIGYDVPVKCGGVMVNPGELIYADFDGVVVIPKSAESNVFELAKEKVHSESKSRKELSQGRSLREVFDKYRAL